MKILLIYDNLNDRGGALIHTKSLEKSLDAQGHTTKLFSYPNSILEKKQNPLFFNKKLYNILKKEIQNFRPDVIHIHNIHKFQNSIYLACKKSKIKTIKTIHDYETINFKTKNPFKLIGHNIEKKFLSSITLISPSKELKDKLAKKNLKSIFLDHFNTFDEIPKLTRKRNGNILYVGYIDQNKGPEVLIKAFKHLNQSGKLFIVGDGPQLSQLKNKYNEPNIIFTGWKSQEEIKRYYQNSSVLVIPSLDPEVSPLVIIEAMHFQIPIIGSNVPGIREAIKNNNSGVLFETGNWKDLAIKIENFPNKKGKYKNNYEKYRKDGHLKNLIKIYKN